MKKKRSGGRIGSLLVIGLIVLGLMNLILPVAGEVPAVMAAHEVKAVIGGLLQLFALFVQWERIFHLLARWLLVPLRS